MPDLGTSAGWPWRPPSRARRSRPTRRSRAGRRRRRSAARSRASSSRSLAASASGSSGTPGWATRGRRTRTPTRSATSSAARGRTPRSARRRAQRAAGAGRWTPIPELYRESSVTVPTEGKTRLALDLEARAISRDPRVTKIDEAQVGDAVSRVAIASTTGVEAEYARTDAWCLAVTLAVEGDETQTGFSYRIARGLDELDWEAVADEAVERGARMLGAAKPTTARVPVVLDQFAAMSFLGVLAGALSADAVQKGRSLFADLVGEQVGSGAVHARRRRNEHRGTGRRSVRRRGCAERPDGAVHEGRADRVPPQRVHGAQGRDGLDRQRQARLPGGAGRRHVELLPRRGGDPSGRAAASGRGRRADPGRERRPFRREPDQRGVQRRRDRAPDRRRGARGAAPRDDDRVDACRRCCRRSPASETTCASSHRWERPRC